MSFLDKLAQKTNNAETTEKKPFNPFLNMKGGNPFAEMLKKQQEQMNQEEKEKEEKTKTENPENAPKEVFMKPAPAPEVKPEPAPEIKEEPEPAKEEEKKNEPATAKEEKPEEPEEQEKKVPADPDKKEEPTPAEKEEKEEEKPKKVTKKRRTRKTKKTEEEKEETPEEEAESEDNDEFFEPPMATDYQTLDDAYSSKETFGKSMDILNAKLDDEEWEKLRVDLAERIQAVHIDRDLNPGTVMVFIDELDALYTEVKLYVTKIDANIDRLMNKQTGMIPILKAKTLSELKGKPSTVQKEAAVLGALQDVVVEGNHLNLLSLAATAQNRKIVLDGFMDLVKSKKQLLITVSSMLKIENTMVNQPRI